MKWRPKWTRRPLPVWIKKSPNFDVLKTFCGEVAVLVLVFPLLDWYLEPVNPDHAHELKVIGWSPIVALFFLALAIACAQIEKKLEGIEKGGGK